MKELKWVDENLEKAIIGVMLTLMILIMGIQVVSRYVFNASLTWSEELTRYLFVWSGFLSLPYTIKAGITLKIDQFYNMLPEGLRKALNVINHVVMIVFFTFMCYHSVGVVGSAIRSGQKSPALGLPMHLVQVAAVVGFGLAVLRTAQVLYSTMKTPKEA